MESAGCSSISGQQSINVAACAGAAGCAGAVALAAGVEAEATNATASQQQTQTSNKAQLQSSGKFVVIPSSPVSASSSHIVISLRWTNHVKFPIMTEEMINVLRISRHGKLTFADSCSNLGYEAKSGRGRGGEKRSNNGNCFNKPRKAFAWFWISRQLSFLRKCSIVPVFSSLSLLDLSNLIGRFRFEVGKNRNLCSYYMADPISTFVLIQISGGFFLPILCKMSIECGELRVMAGNELEV